MDDVVRAFLENEQKLRLVRRIGWGGFGEVWEAESESGIRSAVKVSLDSIDEQNPAVKKELENLKLVKALTGHPHIVSLLDYWVVSGYLVTRWELATDGTLLDMLERYRQDGQPGIPPRELLKWIYEAADGLDFLHEKGIYHRDIKPQNLLLFHGHVKLGDLGLAKLVGASTASHTGSGTFGYLPPEAWEDRRLTPSVDLYSLAATYIKLRTGKEPFGTNPVEIVERQKGGAPILEGLEDWERPLLLEALHSVPIKRFNRGTRTWVRELLTRRQRIESVSHAAESSLRTNISGFTANQTAPYDPGRGDASWQGPTITAQVLTTEKLQGTSATDSATWGVPVFVGTLLVCAFLGVLVLLALLLDRERPEVRVGDPDAPTLELAVRRCSSGGIIRLPPGMYRLNKPLEINKPVELVGDGMETTRVVSDGEGWVILVTAPRFTARGISFEHLGSNSAHVMVIDSASVTIEECRFRGGVWDEQNKRGGDGLRIRGATMGVIKNCLATQNGLHGIELSGLVEILLEGNTCAENKDCGIAYFESAGGTARNNVCRNNALGIGLSDQAAPTLEGNMCEGNLQCGIGYFENAGGIARRNVCRGNRDAEIRIQDNAKPSLQGNDGTIERAGYR